MNNCIVDIKDLSCPICDDLLFSSVMAEDGILYCDECFEKLIYKKNVINSPLLGTTISTNSTKSLIMKKIIIQLIQNTNTLDDIILQMTPHDILKYDIADELKICPKFSSILYFSNKRDYLTEYIFDYIVNGNHTEDQILSLLIKHQNYFNKSPYVNVVTTYMSNDKNQTLLMTLCGKKMEKAAIYLLTNYTVNINLSINFEDIHKNTALTIACMNNLSDIALLLLARPDIVSETVNSDDDTPFLLACSNNMTKVVEKLLDEPFVNYNRSNIKGNNALLLLCKNKSFDVLSKLLNKKMLDYDRIDKDGNTALYYAIYNNFPDKIIQKIKLHTHY